MNFPHPSFSVPVELTNPGQFFACCGLLEIADRLWPGAVGWFEVKSFNIALDSSEPAPFAKLIHALSTMMIRSRMSDLQVARLQDLGEMSAKERRKAGLEDEKKHLEALRREEPILLGEPITPLLIDWFQDDYTGGARFKTWAGQQSVLSIAMAMQAGIERADILSEGELWTFVSGTGLPFNFDSDMGEQGTALDVGFSSDPLASSAATRIESGCRPAVELLSFIGLQRFRPKSIVRERSFVYTAWSQPFTSLAAAGSVCGEVVCGGERSFEFTLMYRTKYLKSFLQSNPVLMRGST